MRVDLRMRNLESVASAKDSRARPGPSLLHTMRDASPCAQLLRGMLVAISLSRSVAGSTLAATTNHNIVHRRTS